ANKLDQAIRYIADLYLLTGKRPREILEEIKNEAKSSTSTIEISLDDEDFEIKEKREDPIVTLKEKYFADHPSAKKLFYNLSNLINSSYRLPSGVASEHHWRVLEKLVELAEKCIETGWCRK
ncbi:MAG: hypothetical protein GXO00_02755, partial [Candidatus Diapherotrites archaeon]|nr:hypothetical protein [Candidatus Diapherotrites archaeon]